MDPEQMAPEDLRVLGIVGTEDPLALDTEGLEVEALDAKALAVALADQIEYDDHRGLKFKEMPWSEAKMDAWKAGLHPSLIFGGSPVRKERAVRERTVRGSRGRPCPIPTTKGNRCPNNCEPFRPACHVHDPQGKFAKQNPKYRKRMIAQLDALGIKT